MAQVNEEFLAIATTIFRHKNEHKKIAIGYHFSFPLDPNECLNVVGMKISSDKIERANSKISKYDYDRGKSEDVFVIRNGDQILDTFKYFGHVMVKLVAYGFYRNVLLRAEFIGTLITKYCSESLVDIDIHDSEVLKHIKKPLIKIQNISLRDNIRFDRSKVPLNELFPAVRHLNLHQLNEHSISHFDFHMPYLEHITIALYQGNKDYSVPEVFVKNPKIRSVSLTQLSYEFVQKLNTILPQIETLSLKYPGEQNVGSVRFNNVTTLILEGWPTEVAGLHFPQLKSMEFDYNDDPAHCGDYDYLNDNIRFFNDHKHLSHLHMYYGMMSDSTLHQLVANLTNLVEFTIERYYKDYYVSSAAIVEVLKTHPRINQLNCIHLPENGKIELRQQLKDKWNMSVIKNGLSFRRIHSNI